MTRPVEREAARTMRMLAVSFLTCALVSCTSNAPNSCPTDGGANSVLGHSKSALPSGPCAGSSECQLTTQDLCPGAHYPGPRQTWLCSCTAGAWQCHVTQQTKAVCLPSDGGRD